MFYRYAGVGPKILCHVAPMTISVNTLRRHNEYEISMGMTGRNASGIGPSPEQMTLCYHRLSCLSIYF